MTTYKKEEFRQYGGEYLPEESLLRKACRYGAVILLAGGAAFGFYKGATADNPRNARQEIRAQQSPTSLEKTVESKDDHGLAQKTAAE